MTRRAAPSVFQALLAAALLVCAPARAELVQKPALSVSAYDGRFTGYSAALPLDLSTDAEKTLLTARVAGDLANPTYNLDLRLTRPTDDDHLGGRDLALGASWNARQAAVSSSLSRLIGFGFLPRANYVRLSMDMNAVQPVETRRRTPVTRANLRSALVLDGQDVGSIAFGGGSTG
ncbi:MAG: hypothetical protein JWP92_3353, partial [Caulobacter sp.]|nr:hypothetical protein [Caulobacter sp.]